MSHAQDTKLDFVGDDSNLTQTMADSGVYVAGQDGTNRPMSVPASPLVVLPRSVPAIASLPAPVSSSPRRDRVAASCSSWADPSSADKGKARAPNTSPDPAPPGSSLLDSLVSLAWLDGVGENNIPALKGDLRLIASTVDQLLRAHAADKGALQDATLAITNTTADLQDQLHSSPNVCPGGTGSLQKMEHRLSVLAQVMEASDEVRSQEIRALHKRMEGLGDSIRILTIRVGSLAAMVNDVARLLRTQQPVPSAGGDAPSGLRQAFHTSASPAVPIPVRTASSQTEPDRNASPSSLPRFAPPGAPATSSLLKPVSKRRAVDAVDEPRALKRPRSPAQAIQQPAPIAALPPITSGDHPTVVRFGRVGWADDRSRLAHRRKCLLRVPVWVRAEDAGACRRGGEAHEACGGGGKGCAAEDVLE